MTAYGQNSYVDHRTTDPYIGTLYHPFEMGIGMNFKQTPVHNSAVLQIKSNQKGLLIPRMTNQKMENIDTPANGLLVFNTDKKTFAFYDKTSEKLLYLSNTATCPWQTNGTNTYLTNSSENVGIGTDAPSVLLTLNSQNGGKSVGITQNYLNDNKKGISTLEFTTSDGQNQATRMLIRGNTQNADIEFFTGQKDNEQLSMIIDGSSGNVFINNQLWVKEDIWIQDFEPDDWGDYVFEPDYNLMSILEVEKFITENNHLPDVPSAQEIGENGFKLAEMDALQMQKIEELTLYIIDLQKQIAELQKQVEDLKNND